MVAGLLDPETSRAAVVAARLSLAAGLLDPQNQQGGSGCRQAQMMWLPGCWTLKPACQPGLPGQPWLPPGSADVAAGLLDRKASWTAVAAARLS